MIMRSRGRRADKYLQVRIEQLKEEIPKNEGDDLTVEWYNRLIQELQWVLDVDAEVVLDDGHVRSNCWMGENVQ
jgi:hypothetical protein